MTTPRYPRTLATMTREGFTSVIQELSENGPVRFVADADIDSDGAGPSHGDKFHQEDTTLHFQGEELNADEDLYIVVPPVICLQVKGMVLGCQAIVTNKRNGRSVAAVVGDIGPMFKDGEVSIALAEALGVPSSPVNGGEDDAVIEYVIYPGQPGKVQGKQYQLQRYGRSA